MSWAICIDSEIIVGKKCSPLSWLPTIFVAATMYTLVSNDKGLEKVFLFRVQQLQRVI